MEIKSEDYVEPSIARLLTEFCRRVDSGAGESVADLFTDDAVIETPHFRLTGRKAVHDWFSERAKSGSRISRHFWSNLTIHHDPDTNEYSVTANALTFVGAPPAPCHGAKIAVGESHDRIVFIDGRPLFASRKLTVFFEGRIEAPETDS